MPETETGIEVKPEPPKLDPVTSLYPFLINSWSGECLEGVPHGFGRCEFKSGTVYVGNMSYGLMHGKGTVAFRDPSTISRRISTVKLKIPGHAKNYEKNFLYLHNFFMVAYLPSPNSCHW